MSFSIPEVTKPFADFKWRWMDFMVEESYNRPDILLGVTRAIKECEGKAASDPEFIDKLKTIQADLLSETDINLVPEDVSRNVLRRQGRYWRGLGILSAASTRSLALTDFGTKYADGTVSNDDFVSTVVKNHRLPNPRVENEDVIQRWRLAGLSIKPLELILGILACLDRISPEEQRYVTPEELIKVVVPLSIVWKDPKKFADAVLQFRQTPALFSKLPDCTPESNDKRMVREHLLFLYEFEVLNKTSGSTRGRYQEKYFLSISDVDSVEALINLPQPMPSAEESDGAVVPITFTPTASRSRKLVEVTIRPNQAGFKKSVLNNFGGKCLLTGETASDVLIACHIHEVRDGGSDNSDNGLLLRADLHILFDNNKLRISDAGQVVLSPDLNESPTYSNLPEKVILPETVNKDMLRRSFEYGRILDAC